MANPSTIMKVKVSTDLIMKEGGDAAVVFGLATIEIFWIVELVSLFLSRKETGHAENRNS